MGRRQYASLGAESAPLRIGRVMQRERFLGWKCRMSERIVFVERHIEAAEFLWTNAMNHGFRPEIAFDFDTATTILSQDPLPDALILASSEDERINLSFLRTLRTSVRTRHMPVLIVAPASEESRSRAFDAGASDYVAAPFSVSELFSRLRAVLRRMHDTPLESRPEVRLDARPEGPAGMTIDGLSLDESAHRILVTAPDTTRKDLSLSSTQYRLFSFLWSHAGEVLSREAIVKAVWGDNAGVKLTLVDSQVHRLRVILRGAGYALLIETILREGYRLVNHL
jgi:two-component system phosphate regulon response regulator PhoB